MKIAQRFYKIAEDTDPVVVSLFAPNKVEEADYEEWQCRIEIAGKTLIEANASGIDAFQAIQSAQTMIRFELKKLGKDLQWDGSIDAGDLGLPMLVPSYLGRAFSDEIEKHIEDSVVAYTKRSELAAKRV